MTGCWVVAVALSTCALGEPSAGGAPVPAVLTRAREVRYLDPETAARGLPVRLEAVITYVDLGNIVFVQDATAGTHLHNLPRGSEWHRGMRILVEGKTMPGLYVPGVKTEQIRVLGPGESPAPLRVTIDDLDSGIYHYQWVEVEGIGRSVATTGENTSTVRLAVGSRMLEVHVDEAPPRDLEGDLIDARLRVQGLAAGVINNRRQLVAPYLKIRSFRTVSVIEPPPDSARLPVVPVDGFLRFTPEGASGRRVKVRGVVLSAPAGGPVYLRDGERAIMVASKPAEALEPGDAIEVLGFPQMGAYRAFLADASLRRIGRETPPPPRRLTVGQLLKGTHDADLVEVEGQLVASYAGPDGLTITAQEGNTTFQVHCPGSRPPSWETGSRLAIRGICRNVVTGSSNQSYDIKPASFELWADAPESLRLLGRPSWWTPRRLSGALGTLIVAIGAALAWIYVLRRRVREQTAIIRAQLAREVVLEERQRIAREVHDTLEQELVGLSLRLDAAAVVAEPRTLSLLGTTRHLVSRIQAEVRDLVWNLREQADAPRELGQSLSRLVGDLPPSPIRLDVAVQGEPWSLPSPIEHNLLRIAQEALTNALKHADARSVRVEVAYEPDHLSLRIHDDGRGLDGAGEGEARPGHFGLIGMRERARKIAARLEIESTPGQGTTVEVRVNRPPGSGSMRGDGDGPGTGTDHDPGGGRSLRGPERPGRLPQPRG